MYSIQNKLFWVLLFFAKLFLGFGQKTRRHLP